MNAGQSFSVEEYACDCYRTPGFPDEDCPHPTQKREAFLDDLTDGQLKFAFLAEQEREKMKKEKVDAEQNKQQMKHRL